MTLQKENLDPKLKLLGLEPLRRHLHKVQIEYGKVTGTTAPLATPDSPQVKVRQTALHDSIRHYAGAVIGSVQRK
ncbi:MAG: hypothetical protein EXR72_20115 [Myxococcales bacterium]|nr:hypothetical protein [Myxococcales bacterium]